MAAPRAQGGRTALRVPIRLKSFRFLGFDSVLTSPPKPARPFEADVPPAEASAEQVVAVAGGSADVPAIVDALSDSGNFQAWR